METIKNLGGRPIQETTYQNYLDYCNRDRRMKMKMECECGKIFYEGQRERHLVSNLHKKLLKMKEDCENVKIMKEKKKEEEERKQKEEEERMQKEEEERLRLEQEQKTMKNDLHAKLKGVSFSPEQLEIIQIMLNSLAK
jgi:hypothetical protein